jgi:hypothetical protein
VALVETARMAGMAEMEFHLAWEGLEATEEKAELAASVHSEDAAAPAEMAAAAALMLAEAT